MADSRALPAPLPSGCGRPEESGRPLASVDEAAGSPRPSDPEGLANRPLPAPAPPPSPPPAPPPGPPDGLGMPAPPPKPFLSPPPLGPGRPLPAPAPAPPPLAEQPPVTIDEKAVAGPPTPTTVATTLFDGGATAPGQSRSEAGARTRCCRAARVGSLGGARLVLEDAGSVVTGLGRQRSRGSVVTHDRECAALGGQVRRTQRLSIGSDAEACAEAVDPAAVGRLHDLDPIGYVGGVCTLSSCAQFSTHIHSRAVGTRRRRWAAPCLR